MVNPTADQPGGREAVAQVKGQGLESWSSLAPKAQKGATQGFPKTDSFRPVKSLRGQSWPGRPRSRSPRGPCE